MTQADLHKRLREEILAAYLADNTKARLLQPDGEYVRAPTVGEPFSAQDHLMRLAEGADEKVAGSIGFPPAPVTIQPSAKGKNGTKATTAARRARLLDGEVDGRGLDDGASGGGHVDGVGAGGEAARTGAVGFDSATATAAQQTEGGQCEEQSEDAPAAGATREDEDEEDQRRPRKRLR